MNSLGFSPVAARVRLRKMFGAVAPRPATITVLRVRRRNSRREKRGRFDMSEFRSFKADLVLVNNKPLVAITPRIALTGRATLFLSSPPDSRSQSVPMSKGPRFHTGDGTNRDALGPRRARPPGKTASRWFRRP